MADAFIQVRTDEDDKRKAAEILASLGTNMSAVINMMLKQIILTGGIPFDVVLPYEEKKISGYRINDVENVLMNVPESVEEIWVFGSTVTPHCRPQSDLDICVIGHTTMKEESVMFKAAECSVDIISATPEEFAEQSKLAGSIFNEVLEKGILVYRRGEDIQWK